MQAFEPLLEGRGARRVVAAEAHAPQSDARGVEIAAGRDEIDHRRDSGLVVAADRKIVFRLALAGPVEHEGRDAAIEERRS